MLQIRSSSIMASYSKNRAKKKTVQQKKFNKNKRLVALIFKLAPKIISFARTFGKKLKKKNSHQITIFPDSVKAVPFVSSDRNFNLINQYKRKTDDWYPFYFSNGNTFVDNRHLTIFSQKKSLPVDFSNLGVGVVTCMGQFVSFSIASIKNQKNNKFNRSPVRTSNKNQNLKEQFEISSPTLQKGQLRNTVSTESSNINISSRFTQSFRSISNLKQKLIANMNGFKFSQNQLVQDMLQQVKTTNIVFLGTNSGYILIIDPKTNNYHIQKVQNNLEINSITIFKNYIMVKNDQMLIFYKFTQTSIPTNQKQNNKTAIKLIQVFNIKIKGIGGLNRNTFAKYKDNYYVFFIDDGGAVKKLCLKERLITNSLDAEVICQPVIYNPFTNLRIFYQPSYNRIVLTASCTKQILLYSFNYKQNKFTQIYKMPNPKNPPMNPRIHIPSCIEYISNYTNQNYEGEKNMRNSENRQSQSFNGRSSSKNGNLFDEYGQKNEEQLIVAISFTERAYFIKIQGNYCEISRRAKFLHRILKIQSYKYQGLFIILHNQQCRNLQPQNSPNLQQQTKPKSTKLQIIIVATLLRQVLSFKFHLHTEILQKIQYYVDINRNLDFNYKKFKAAFGLINQELLILTENCIERVSINTWRQIYQKMLLTENIQLLNFLILIKNYSTIFLNPPQSISGLQKFFPTDKPETKQILLQFYYQTNQKPPEQFISQIINQDSQLLIPFILEHKISNLSQLSKQMLIQYWKFKDQRIVEELIMAGCEFGWEIAISKGWMRALRKIVSMGVQIHFPLLKLESFVVAQLKKLQQLDKNADTNLQYQANCTQVQQKIHEYCQQIIEYTLLALEYFLDPQEIQQLQDLKQFILTLLRPQIIDNCIRYQPNDSVRIISKLFNSQQRVYLIDKLNIEDFIHFQKQFKYIIRTNFLQLSQCIFSYMSQTYYELTHTKNYKNDQKAKFRQILTVQHAKIVRYQMQNISSGIDSLHHYSVSKCKFQFTRPYLLEMLGNLVSHNNENLKQLIHDQCVELQKERQEYECYMQDILVKIWMKAKNSPTQNHQQSSNNQVQPIDHKQIRDLMAVHQQINNSNNFLLICFMVDLPANQYCVKILRKFIYCQNGIIRQRIFDWLFPTMQDQQCRQTLQNQLMNHLKSIIQINKQRSRELFDKYFHNKQRQIIKKIDNDPHLQLDYLQMIIQDADENETNVEEYYLNLYLKLLINQQPERVVKVLEQSLQKGKTHKIKYDMQQALKVSLQKQNYNQKHKIQMYLYEKIGEIQKCIGSYIKILEQLFWEYIDIYENTQEKDKELNLQGQRQQRLQTKNQYQFSEQSKIKKKLSLISEMISHKITSQSQARKNQLQQLISQQFKQLTDLIFRQSIKTYEYLKIPLDAMIMFSQQIKQQKLKYRQHYHGILAFYFGKIIVQSFQKNCFQYFNQWLKQQNKIDLNSLKKYLFQGYNKIISQEILLQNISQIDKNVLIQNVKDILFKMQKSVYSQAICAVCGGDFQQFQGETILFNCGHLYHQNCIEQDQNGQDYCWECVYSNQIQAMIDHSEMNMVALLQKYCQKKSTNQIQQKVEQNKQVILPRNKKILNRFGIFDKKVSTLDNQSQILEMKLQILDYYQSIKNQDN